MIINVMSPLITMVKPLLSPDNKVLSSYLWTMVVFTLLYYRNFTFTKLVTYSKLRNTSMYTHMYMYMHAPKDDIITFLL